MRPESSDIHDASFRDPSGYVFFDGDTLKRVVNPIYFPQYRALTESGFYQALIGQGLLVAHRETSVSDESIVLTPDLIPFVTYPYEWGFEQFRHAALLTLKIQRYALSRGFTLKDASAYNVTFFRGNPVFIDTLSFDFYEDGTPWRAYKQFITHFFGPLVLAQYHGTAIFRMIQSFIDGIPIEVIASLLPATTRVRPALYTNIHLLAKMEHKHRIEREGDEKIPSLSKKAQENVLKSLFETIVSLKLRSETEWQDYYSEINYDRESFEAKREIIQRWVKSLQPARLIDVGGNDGTFARSIQKDAGHILVPDVDPNAVDRNYRQARKNKEAKILPFVCDVLQPSPGIGFGNTERSALINRLAEYEPDVTMALALIHHITLSGNVPFEKSAAFFAGFSEHLIIEFPGRGDSWVEYLISGKREFADHFSFYSQENFEAGYGRFFDTVEKQPIPGATRVLYLLKRREGIG